MLFAPRSYLIIFWKQCLNENYETFLAFMLLPDFCEVDSLLTEHIVCSTLLL